MLCYFFSYTGGINFATSKEHNNLTISFSTTMNTYYFTLTHRISENAAVPGGFIVFMPFEFFKSPNPAT